MELGNLRTRELYSCLAVESSILFWVCVLFGCPARLGCILELKLNARCQPKPEDQWRPETVGLRRWLRPHTNPAASSSSALAPCVKTTVNTYGQRCSSSAFKASHVTPLAR